MDLSIIEMPYLQSIIYIELDTTCHLALAPLVFYPMTLVY